MNITQMILKEKAHKIILSTEPGLGSAVKLTEAFSMVVNTPVDSTT